MDTTHEGLHGYGKIFLPTYVLVPQGDGVELNEFCKEESVYIPNCYFYAKQGQFPYDQLTTSSKYCQKL